MTFGVSSRGFLGKRREAFQHGHANRTSCFHFPAEEPKGSALPQETALPLLEAFPPNHWLFHYTIHRVLGPEGRPLHMHTRGHCALKTVEDRCPITVLSRRLDQPGLHHHPYRKCKAKKNGAKMQMARSSFKGVRTTCGLAGKPGQ